MRLFDFLPVLCGRIVPVFPPSLDGNRSRETEISNYLAKWFVEWGFEAEREVVIGRSHRRRRIDIEVSDGDQLALIEVKSDEAYAYQGIGQLLYYREFRADEDPMLVLAAPALPYVIDVQLETACKRVGVHVLGYGFDPLLNLDSPRYGRKRRKWETFPLLGDRE